MRLITGPKLAGLALAVFALAVASAFALVWVIEDAQGRLAPYAWWLFGFALLGLVVLMGLIGVQLGRLWRERQRQEPGSAIASRFAKQFAWIALPPIILVFLFALNFLARSVDQWFDVRTDAALSDALQVGRDLIEQERGILQTRVRALQERLPLAADWQTELEGEVDRGGFDQIAIFDTDDGSVIASATDDPRWLLPESPDADARLRVQQSGLDLQLLPLDKDGLVLRALAAGNDALRGAVLIQAHKSLPAALGLRVRNIESSFNDYQRLNYLRTALKTSFLMVLTVVVLLALLMAVLAALTAARRMAAPIADLSIATQEIAQGNLAVAVQADTHDELSQLANSFNHMANELAQAQTREREAQANIESARAYLDTVLQQLRSGVVSMSGEGELVTANAAARALLRLPEDFQSNEVEYLRLTRQTHPPLLPLVDLLQTRAKENRAAWREELTLHHAQGETQVLLVRGDRLPGKGGMVAIFDDLTMVAQAQREAAWSEVAKRLAHEIKNPLTPIQLSAERLQYKLGAQLNAPDKELLDKSTRTIVAQVDTLKNLVNAFGDYARNPALKFTIADPHPVLHETLDLFDSDPRAVIDRDFGAVVQLRFDPDRLRQLINNLVKNALEAAPEHQAARIEVRTRVDSTGKQWLMEISDDGPGLPKDFDATWFEPYRTGKPKGTGLGLSIVQKIIDEHGGSIRAENRDRGGARFVVQLPLSTA